MLSDVVTCIAECRAISMGQGQEVHARRLMNSFMSVGGWVLLQNCHLSLAYIEEVWTDMRPLSLRKRMDAQRSG